MLLVFGRVVSKNTDAFKSISGIFSLLQSVSGLETTFYNKALMVTGWACMNEPFFQLHTGDTFSQNMSAGVWIHTLWFPCGKNNTIQTNYDPEKPTGGDAE